MQWDLAVSSLGNSLKGSGSSLGTRREIIERRPKDSSQECGRLSDWRECSPQPAAGFSIADPGAHYCHIRWPQRRQCRRRRPGNRGGGCRG
ncbi:hypothetical protein BHM03_00040470 [Ensete ventricosum]|nr:hypothetical protein BHM03_00040470 [Ensete ventricosum]